MKIADALYGLGMAYRHNLERLDLSNESFGRFIVETSGDDERWPQALYYLYLNAKELGEHSVAQKYGDELVKLYPGHKFAQLVENPDYAKVLTAGGQEAEAYYQEVFTAFELGQYKVVEKAYDEAHKRFGADEPRLSKFALLRAMAVGKSVGREAYVQSLRQVVAQYPNTPEQIKAREIIRFLTGDDNAFNTDWSAVVETTNFEIDKEDLHYVLVVIHNDDVVPMQDVKINISNYNSVFHRLDRLSIRSFVVDRQRKTQAVLVRKFENQDKALAYLDNVKKRQSEFVPEDTDYEIFAISQHNYRQLMTSSNLRGYKIFHENNVQTD